RSLGTIGLLQVVHDGFKQGRRNSQIMRGKVCSLEFSTQRREGFRILIIAINVVQQADQFLEGSGVDATVLLKTVMSPGAELIEVPPRFGNSNDRYVEMSSLHHRLQRRKNLLVSQVARCTEEYERIRVGISHTCFSLGSFGFVCRFLQVSAEFVTHRRQE